MRIPKLLRARKMRAYSFCPSTTSAPCIKGAAAEETVELQQPQSAAFGAAAVSCSSKVAAEVMAVVAVAEAQPSVR